MGMWDEFSFLEDGQITYKENSLYGWCEDNSVKGNLILNEWDYEKNLDNNGIVISPKDVCRGSDKKVWWKCSRCGNSYQLPIRSRIAYVTGCKKCRTKGTSYSEQFIFYGIQQCFKDAESRVKVDKNMEFDIVIPSIKTYIEYSGEFWHTEYAKKDHLKREYCKENNIRFIEIWEMKKYVPLTVEEDIIKYKFNDARQDETLYQVLLTLCSMLGFENPELDYNKIVQETNLRMLRPVKNSIIEDYPDLEKEWDIKLNNGAKPEYFSSGSAKRIIWTCTKCNNRWHSTISSRTEFRTGCPYCRYNIFSKKYYTKGSNKRKIITFGQNNL